MSSECIQWCHYYMFHDDTDRTVLCIGDGIHDLLLTHVFNVFSCETEVRVLACFPFPYKTLKRHCISILQMCAFTHIPFLS